MKTENVVKETLKDCTIQNKFVPLQCDNEKGMENNKKKVICYLRTSTEKQEIESQKQTLTKAILNDCYNVDEIEYIGKEGISACTLKAEYFQLFDQMEAVINKGGIECVYAYCITRFVRMDESRFTRFINFCITKHVQLKIYEPTMALLNADGSVNNGMELLMKITAITAKQQTEELKAQTKRGKDMAREMGKFVGGRVPLGYTIDEHGFPQVNEDEKRIINELFELYATGEWSYRMLANEMNKRGYRYTIATIRMLLGRKAYTGTSIYQPIVPVELFNKVAQMRKINDGKYGKVSHQRVHSFFGCKILKCPECGYSLVANGTYYVCPAGDNAKGRGIRECSHSVTLNIKLTDSLLWYVAREIELRKLKAQGTIDKAALKKENELLQTKISNISDTMLSKCEGKKKRIIESYVECLISKDERAARIAKVDAEIRALKAEIEGYKHTIQLNKDKIENTTLKGLFFLNLKEVNEATEKEMQAIVRRNIDIAHIYKHDNTTTRLYMKTVEGEELNFYVKGRANNKFFVMDANGKLEDIYVPLVVRTTTGLQIQGDYCPFHDVETYGNDLDKEITMEEMAEYMEMADIKIA